MQLKQELIDKRKVTFSEILLNKLQTQRTKDIRAMEELSFKEIWNINVAKSNYLIFEIKFYLNRILHLINNYSSYII